MVLFVNKEMDVYYKKYPVMFIDIGGSGGIPQRWMELDRNLKKIIFEPDIRAYNELRLQKDEKTTIINSALGKDKEKREFYIAKKQQVSSLYRPNMSFIKDFPDKERFDVESIIELQTDTLDSQLALNEVNDIDFIKIDTQGSELSILEGAETTINSGAIGFEIEVEFSPIYDGQPLFADIDVFMRKHGFQLFDLESCYWKRSNKYWRVTRERQNKGNSKGQIVFADALYFKTTEAFFIALKRIKVEEQRKAKVLKFITIAALYGHFDYAIDICNKSTVEGILDKCEEDIIIRNLESKIIQE